MKHEAGIRELIILEVQDKPTEVPDYDDQATWWVIFLFYNKQN